MMELSFLSYKLVKLKIDHLEMVRNWRNSENINQYMVYKNHISKSQQLDWFKKINNKHNFYFIIYKDDTPIGVVDIKDVDWKTKSADTGIFIALEKYWQTDASTSTLVMIVPFVLTVLKLENIYCKVLATNKAVISYNQSAGYSIVDENKEYVTMKMLDTEKVLGIAGRLKNVLCNLNKTTNEYVKIKVDVADINNDETTVWLINGIIKKQFPDYLPGNDLIIL